MYDPSTITIPWRSQLRKPADAPNDGTYFFGIPKGKAEPCEVVWDADMRCYLSTDYACFDALSCWWPLDTPQFPRSFGSTSR